MLRWWNRDYMEEAESRILHSTLSSPNLKVTRRFVDGFGEHSLNTLEVSLLSEEERAERESEGNLSNARKDENEKKEEKRKKSLSVSSKSEGDTLHEKGIKEKEKENENEEQPSHPHTTTLIMAHGYGAGLGFWYKNIEPIVNGTHTPLRLIAFDWPGFGRSARVPWDLNEFEEWLRREKESEKEEEDRREGDEKNDGNDEDGGEGLHHQPDLGVSERVRRRLIQTENFFVESLEKWRVGVGADDVILLGHSLGGYFASLYALRYPHRVRTLILASPAGVPPPPPNIPQYQGAFRALMRLWEWRVAPQSAVRLFGPFGSSLVDKAAKWRFGLEGEEAEMVSQYLYRITAGDPSGERCLFDVLAPGAWAYSPLQSRLEHLNKEMNVCFIYGLYDWMDYRAAIPICESLGPRARLFRISDAGHQLYLENPEAFNRLICHIIDHSHGVIPQPDFPDVFLS